MRPMGEVNPNGSYNFEFHKPKSGAHHKALASRSKATPSKWDDAQKWLTGFSGGDGGKNKPRNSNADDRRLLNSASQRGRESTSSVDLSLYEDIVNSASTVVQDEGETKKIDSETMWRMSKPMEEEEEEIPIPTEVKSMCLRDVGTEMTPIASQEPSRSATPIRATSPIESRAVSPGRGQNQTVTVAKSSERKGEVEVEVEVHKMGAVVSTGCARGKVLGGGLEARALAWEEAERANYTAR